MMKVRCWTNPSFDEALKHYLNTREFLWSNAVSAKIDKIQSRSYASRLRFEVPQGAHTAVLYNVSARKEFTSGEHEREIQIVRKYKNACEFNAPMGAACEEPYTSLMVSFLIQIQ